MTAWMPVAKSNFALTFVNRFVRFVVSVASSCPRKALPAKFVMNCCAQAAFWVLQPTQVRELVVVVRRHGRRQPLGRLEVLLVHQRARDRRVGVGVEVAGLAGVDLLLGDELVAGLGVVRVEAQVADHVVVFDARDAPDRGAADAGLAVAAGRAEDAQASGRLLRDDAATGARVVPAGPRGATRAWVPLPPLPDPLPPLPGLPPPRPAHPAARASAAKAADQHEIRFIRVLILG